MDHSYPNGTVRTVPREDNGDCVLLSVLGKGAEEIIDRHERLTTSAAIEETQCPIDYGHVLSWGDHVDLVPLDDHVVLHLYHFHGRGPGDHLGHEAGVMRLEMGYDNIGHVRIGGGVLRRRPRWPLDRQPMSPGRRSRELFFVIRSARSTVLLPSFAFCHRHTPSCSKLAQIAIR